MITPTEEVAELDSLQQSPLSPTSSSKLRTLELALVLGIAFSSAFVISISVLYGEKYQYAPTKFHIVHTALMEMMALLVLGYVLFRQGRGFKDIGFGFEWRDVPRSIGVLLLAYLGYVVVYYCIVIGYLVAARPFVLQKPPLVLGISLISVLFIFINPFFEELIVRAYFISELTALMGKAWIAVIVSTVFQAAYHLYQGYIPAVMYAGIFLVFSIYYSKSKRIGPVILAHLYMDLSFLLFQSK
jgi:membrane protease YdiL (CAAX protease family)